MKVYICGAVGDILREFQAKLEKRGVEVIGADEYSVNRRYSPPLDAEAVVIGTDQSGHVATSQIVTECKERGLPYAMGELRKWALLYPRMLQAGILSESSSSAAQQEEDMGLTAAKMLPEHAASTNEEAVKAVISETLQLMLEGLKGKAKSATISYNEGRVHAEVEYLATLTVDL